MSTEANKIVITRTAEDLETFRSKALEIARTVESLAAFVEVGTRSGNSAFALLSAIKESEKPRWLFTIDPYGFKPYQDSRAIHTDNDYGEQHYRNAMRGLSQYSYDNNLLHCHWRLTSFDFMKIADSITFWWDGHSRPMKFGFVFLDGEHHNDVVMPEVNWFKERTVDGGVIVIDDVQHLDLTLINELLPGYEVEGNKLYYKHATS